MYSEAIVKERSNQKQTKKWILISQLLMGNWSQSRIHAVIKIDGRNYSHFVAKTLNI
jgi:hypothetical protein